MSNAETFVLPKATITVYRMDNEAFEQIGEIDRYTSLVWPKSYGDVGNFELHCPVTEHNMEMVAEGHIITLGGTLAAKMEIITASTDEEYDFEYIVKGRTLECILDSRIVWGTYSTDNSEKFPSTIMMDLVRQNAVNPSNSNRKIPYLELGTDPQAGTKISHQQTGGSLFFELQDICEMSGIGFEVQFHPREQRLVFQPIVPNDRSYNNTSGNLPVVFDTDTEDIIRSEYYLNSQDEYNVAFVAGEGEGKDRKTTSIDSGVRGLERKETYVDARDVQSEYSDDDGNMKTVSPEKYMEQLRNRGLKALSEMILYQTYDGSVRGVGYVAYEYGVDYEVGDIVTMVDRRLGVTIDAPVTRVEQQFDDEYNIQITFGEASPTVMRKVRRIVRDS